MYETYKGEQMVNISPGTQHVYLRLNDKIIELNNIINVAADIKYGDCTALSIIGSNMTIYELHPLVMDNLKLHSPRTGNDYSLRVPNLYKPTPKRVIFSGPATTIIWMDGSKTTVKCSNKDIYDEDVGIAMCYLKKLYGNKGNYNNIFREAREICNE